MPKIMWSGSYTQQGTKGVISDGGTKRREAIEKMLTSMGGRLECLYFSFGSDDVMLIADVPDNVSAAAIGLAVAASGSVHGRMTILLTPEEIDQATRKSPAYRAPGT
jgi:uncharacterized protein with GYD domain